MTQAEFDRHFQALLRAIQGGGPSVTDWIVAIASSLTFAVALVAAIYARGQIEEARKARQLTVDLETERSQPYVVMYMHASVASEVLIDLVIKNYGQTAATDVHIDLDPKPRRTRGGASVEQEVGLPDVIPTLAPGQEWRTLWDNGRERNLSSLPDRHEGTVTYKGLNGKDLSSKVVLDWSIYKTRRWVELKTVHDVAKSVDEMSKTVARWGESLSGPLSVVVRNGHRKDSEDEAYNLQRLAEINAVQNEGVLESIFQEQPVVTDEPKDEKPES
jgi:hypothetical protein